MYIIMCMYLGWGNSHSPAPMKPSALVTWDPVLVIRNVHVTHCNVHVTYRTCHTATYMSHMLRTCHICYVHVTHATLCTCHTLQRTCHTATYMSHMLRTCHTCYIMYMSHMLHYVHVTHVTYMSHMLRTCHTGVSYMLCMHHQAQCRAE